MDIATTLLEYGAKANAESKAGFSPLHLSSQEGHTDMSTLLIEHQADVNHKAKVLKCVFFLAAAITKNIHERLTQ
jgi:ankyrin